MSGLSSLPLPATGVPVLSPTTEPAFVREGGAAVKSAYQEAVGFEEMLVEQLSKSLAQTGGLGEGEDGGGAGESESEGQGSMGLLTSMLPQTLSEAVARGGSLGLASQLTKEIDPTAAASSGTAAKPSAPAAGAGAGGSGGASA